jgi:cell division septal protein FtsQ
MYRRYREGRRRRNRAEYRRRSVLTRPSVQITILLVTALIIFILLSSAK